MTPIGYPNPPQVRDSYTDMTNRSQGWIAENEHGVHEWTGDRLNQQGPLAENGSGVVCAERGGV